MARRSHVALYLICVLSLLCRPPAQTAPARKSADDLKEFQLLEKIVNFPFANEQDMEVINGTCRSLLEGIGHRDDADPEVLAAFEEFLKEVAAFTSVETVAGERCSIVGFAQSDDKAVRRLREEVRLSPPAGGAIVRIYPSKEAMPEPIRGLFDEQTSGITRFCRFIAVYSEDRSPEQLQDTISHELAHAYISSCLGLNHGKLPRWFHEGVALYLSDSKDLYSSQSGFDTERISWSPKDYHEYRTVFRYLDATQGRQSVTGFIRQAVQEQSVVGPLQAVVGTTSYETLRSRALRWRAHQQLTYALEVVAVLIVLGVTARLWIRRNQMRAAVQAMRESERAEDELAENIQRVVHDFERLEEAETLDDAVERGRQAGRDVEETCLTLVKQGRALAKAGRLKEANERFNEALRLAPWSPRVTQAVQLALGEIDGIVL